MRPFLSRFLWLWGKLLWKMSPTVRGETLKVFFNTLTSDDKYPVQDCEYL